MSNEGISHDVAFRLLSHVYRRALLECLDRHDGPVSLADAAEDVTLACRDTSISELSDEETREVYLSLHHSHVPQLAAEGAVSYDRDRGQVTLTERGERVVAIHDQLTTTGSIELAESDG